MVDGVLQHGKELSDLREKQSPDQTKKYRTGTERKENDRNLVDDGFLFDPIVLEVVVDVQNENGEIVQVLKVQPEHTQTG